MNTLETSRLTLRRQRVTDAAVYRQLWIERNVRVPPHRQVNLEGRPTEEDIATQIREENGTLRPGLLAAERKGTADVIGYCGLVFNESGSNDEPDYRRWLGTCRDRGRLALQAPRSQRGASHFEPGCR